MTMVAAVPYLEKDAWTDVLRLPTAFSGYGSEPLVQMAAAAHGKTGFLQLHFELRNGRTHLIRNFSSGQQIVRQVHYLDTAIEDMAVVFIQNVGAGILQGDRLRVELVIGDGAKVLVANQGATKVMEMSRNYASQRVDVTVGEGAYAEVLMDPLIPASGSRLYNEVNLTVDPSAKLLYSEHLTPGRVGHGESWAFDLLYSRIRCHRPTGELIMADTNVLEPRRSAVTTPGLFGEFSDMAVMFAVAESHDAAPLADAMHENLQDIEGVVGSASVLPSEVGAHSRMLGSGTTRTSAATQLSWQAARRQLLGVDTPPIYRIKHGFEPHVTRRESSKRRDSNGH